MQPTEAERTFDWRGEYDENLPLPETLTMAQYRRVIFRPDAHFVEGKIVERKLGDATHSRGVMAVASAIDHAAGPRRPHGCISLRLQTSPNTIRVCDYVLLRPDAPYEPVPTVAPLLCVEILGPGQSPADEIDTLRDYLVMGVENIWLVDAVHHTAFTFDADGLHSVSPAHMTLAGFLSPIDLATELAELD